MCTFVNPVDLTCHGVSLLRTQVQGEGSKPDTMNLSEQTDETSPFTFSSKVGKIVVKLSQAIRKQQGHHKSVFLSRSVEQHGNDCLSPVGFTRSARITPCIITLETGYKALPYKVIIPITYDIFGPLMCLLH